LDYNIFGGACQEGNWNFFGGDVLGRFVVMGTGFEVFFMFLLWFWLGIVEFWARANSYKVVADCYFLFMFLLEKFE